MIFEYTLGALIIATTVSEVAPCINSFASVSAVPSSYQNCESYRQQEEGDESGPASLRGTRLWRPLVSQKTNGHLSPGPVFLRGIQPERLVRRRRGRGHRRRLPFRTPKMISGNVAELRRFFTTCQFLSTPSSGFCPSQLQIDPGPSSNDTALPA